MKKIIRITTVPLSLEKLLENQLTYMSSFFQVIAISSDANRLQTFGIANNVETFPLDLTRKITPIKDLLAVIKLCRYLKKEQPVIVHTHTPKAGIVGMLAAKFAGVPIRLHTVAGLPLMEAKGLKRFVLNIVEKLTYSCATRVYPNAKGLKDYILQNKFTSPTKLKVIGNGSSNGINTDYFSPKQTSINVQNQLKNELGILESDFVFVFVGRLVGDKGINELVEVFDKLSNSKTNVKLLLVGPEEKELDPLLPNTIHTIKTNKKIISVGYQQDVRHYFAISNALVFPSYREGFPNVVLQAGAMGLPSIVSDINGCNEIIEQGKNGMIIPVKNWEEIYKAMVKMMEDIPFYEQLKANARKMIASRYEQSLVWDALLEEYNNLLREKGYEPV